MLAVQQTSDSTIRDSGISFFEPPERATFAAVRRPSRRRSSERRRYPGDSPQLEFFGRRLWGQILVQLPGLGLRHVVFREPGHDDLLVPPEAVRDVDHVASVDLPIRLRGPAANIDFATFTSALRLGTRAEEARDVEPQIEPHGAIVPDRRRAIRRSDEDYGRWM